MVGGTTSLELQTGIITDVNLFQAHLAADDPEAALHLVAGALLEGFVLPNSEGFHAWLDRQREEFATAIQAARLAAAGQLEARGDLRGALELYLELLHDDELQESFQFEAMQLEAALGQRSAALRRFERLKQLLSDELDLLPLPETLALAQELGSVASDTVNPSRFKLSDITSSSGSERGGMPLVGRKIQWAMLEGASSGFTLVTGVPGIGKTRLVEAFARTFAPILKLEAIELSLETPLHPVVAALREVLAEPRVLAKFNPLHWRGVLRLLPELEKLEGAGFDGDDLAEALKAIVEPDGIIVLEHLHWFDAASLELLQRLAQHDGIRLLATARGFELTHNPNAQHVLAQLEQCQRLTQIPLGALDESEVLTLTRAMVSASSAQMLVRPLLEATGGNPMFILETLHFLQASGRMRVQSFDPIPVAPKVQAFVLEQLLQLKPKTRRWLELASLGAPEFSPNELGLSETETHDWLEVCVLLGLLEPVTNGRYRFAQPLAREVVVDAMSLERRSLLQRQLEFVNLELD